ncbi:MAG TPA: FG-GAP-like repeat-containing protein [Terriglobia bacterium]|nr:FG-GAP-like repeat-containing protein [Terriglobia bacterium]
MANPINLLLRPWTRTAEAGLRLMERALETANSLVDAVAGERRSETLLAPPLNGPRNADEAAVDFANRLLLIARQHSGNPLAMAASWSEVLRAAGSSFGRLERDGWRQWMALPLQMPLSFGTLLARTSLRGLHAGYLGGVERLPELVKYSMEFFTDLDIFVTLQYNEYLSALIQDAENHPENAAKRLLLGKTYCKLGRYEEAVRELTEAANDPAIRAEALQERMVARYRAGHFAEAIADGAAALDLAPSDNRSRFWMWLGAQKLGGYPPSVPEHQRMELRVGRHPASVQLEEIAATIGLDKTSGGRGTAVFDLEGDGYLDVILSSVHAGCSLYRNNGDGTFTDITVGSGLEDTASVFCIAVGDYNNDGFPDLYVTRMGFYDGESLLFRNNGDGTFTDVTAAAGVRNWGPAFTAQWVDYDCDGHLDLFVTANHGRFFATPAKNRLFHNNGDGTFTDVTARAGIASDYPFVGATWGDYNNDGFPDLFLSSSLGRSQLYRNNGDGTFTNVSRSAGLDAICVGFVALWCDYDNDGWLDLIQFVWSPEADVLHTMIHGERPPHGHSLRLYHNNGDGTFTLVSPELGLNECWGTMTGNAADLNNDGRIELVLGNGGPLMGSSEPSVLYELGEDGRFHNTSFSAGLPVSGKGHGVNMADLAGDGRLCLIVADGGMYPGDLLTTAVYRPKTLPGNYLNVRLVGTKSNRSAIGARLRLEAGGTSQHRMVHGGSGFGTLPLEQHFGLGKLQRIDALEILWPSGLRQRFSGLPVNDTIEFLEGAAGWRHVYPQKSRRGVAAAETHQPAAPVPAAAAGRGDD